MMSYEESKKFRNDAERETRKNEKLNAEIIKLVEEFKENSDKHGNWEEALKKIKEGKDD